MISMHKVIFLREFFRDLRTIGAIIPSSDSLVRKIVRPIDFSEAKYIVELGAGNGCITKTLLRFMQPGAQLFSFDTNERFCEDLRSLGDERLRVINDSAEHISLYLSKFKIKQADYIVSGLPLASLPGHIGENIIDEVYAALKPGGLYIQFQYSLKSYRKFKERFAQVKLGFTPLNIPPAFVYICRK